MWLKYDKSIINLNYSVIRFTLQQIFINTFVLSKIIELLRSPSYIQRLICYIAVSNKPCYYFRRRFIHENCKHMIEFPDFQYLHCNKIHWENYNILYIVLLTVRPKWLPNFNICKKTSNTVILKGQSQHKLKTHR